MTTDKARAEAERIAERMVTFFPSLKGDENGSILIGPHDTDAQPWELLTLRPDPGLGERCCKDLRKFIAAALTARDAEAEKEATKEAGVAALRSACEAFGGDCDECVVKANALTEMANERLALEAEVAKFRAEAEGLREAVRALRKAAVEIASMPTPDGRVADIPDRAMLQLAQEISKAALDAAGGAQ